jgi:predicted Zn-dependent peptidase
VNLVSLPTEIESSQPFGVHERRLSSGLRICLVNQPRLHHAVLHAQIRIGSRFEVEADSGISHFLEHMLYRGTQRHPSAHALSLAFERCGGSLDATTACDAGTLSLSAPPEHLAALLPDFYDVFHQPLLSGIDIERGIVKEEILEALDDDGHRIDADDLIRSLVFEGHGLGRPITGTLGSLESFDVERLRTHHDRFYTGSNTVLIVVGPVGEAEMQALERAFESLPAGQESRLLRPAPQESARFRYVAHSSSQTNLRVGFRAPGWDDPQHNAMEVLVRLLDDGMSTRLYHRICDELGLCYDVSAGYEAYADSGLLELSAETSHSQARRVLTELLDIVRRLRDDGPTSEELEIIRQRFRWQAQSMLDSAEALADFVAEALHNGQSTSLEERCGEIAAVSAEDVQAVARRWCTPENLSVVAVGVAGKARRKELERCVRDYTA